MTLALFSCITEAKSEALNSSEKHEIDAGFALGNEYLSQLRYGYNINEKFRFELEASTGKRKVTRDFFFVYDDIDYRLMAFGVARLPFGVANSAVFVRGGAGGSKVSAYDDIGFSSDIAYGAVVTAGVGIEMFFTKSMAFRLETNLTNDTAFDEISNLPGRTLRDDFAITLATSLVMRF